MDIGPANRTPSAVFKLHLGLMNKDVYN